MSGDNNLTQHNKSPEAFRTISEASEEIGVAPHVLRFWEGKFSNLKPLKRAGGRRFYRPQDILLMRGLKHLLQEQGITIRGVQKLIKERGIQSVRDAGSQDTEVNIGYNEFMAEDSYENNAEIIEVGEEPIRQIAPIDDAKNDEISNKAHPSGNSPALLRALARIEQARLLLDSVVVKS